jgi:hypothetical protein
MIDLLLRHNDTDFGLIDHDSYLFDKSVPAQLRFANDEFLLCLLEADADRKWVYPLTHFLYFRVDVWRRLMERYGVGAQMYRKVPEPARSRLDALGLRDGVTLKSYHDFFDTLHVLFALACGEGLRARQIVTAEGSAFYHLGGTSIGTHHTKDLGQLYIHLRFLELADEPLLHRKYASIAAPFATAAELRPRLPETPQVAQQIRVVDELVDRLRRAFGSDSRGQEIA